MSEWFDPRRVLIVGQIRGRQDVLDSVVNRAIAESAEAIVALGNLTGYHDFKGEFVDLVTARCDAAGIPLWLVDGPSDPHANITASPRLSERVSVLGRGECWEWGGVKLLAAGGGISGAAQKKAYPQEGLAPAEIETCVDAGPFDVLLCHEAPWGCRVPRADGDDPVLFNRMIAQVEMRKGLLRVVEKGQPQQVICAPGGRWKGELRIGRRVVSVDALGDPAGDEGCEVLEITPKPSGCPYHPALGGPPPKSEVPHPAL